MTAAILKRVESDGVKLSLSPSGSVVAEGEESAIEKLAPLIKLHKQEIIKSIKAANYSPSRDESALARLVVRVCRAYDCSDGEIEEAINAALQDYEAAEKSFRIMAKGMGMSLQDNRRFCFECAELKGSSCMAAKRGEIEGADRRYEPVKFLPRRCQKFAPAN